MILFGAVQAGTAPLSSAPSCRRAPRVGVRVFIVVDDDVYSVVSVESALDRAQMVAHRLEVRTAHL